MRDIGSQRTRPLPPESFFEVLPPLRELLTLPRYHFHIGDLVASDDHGIDLRDFGVAKIYDTRLRKSFGRKVRVTDALGETILMLGVD